MSLSGAICKLFQFLANMFGAVVEAVATAVKTVGAAAVDILSEIATSIGDALGLNGFSVLLIAGIGVLAYFMLRPSPDRESSSNERGSATSSRSVIEV